MHDKHEIAIAKLDAPHLNDLDLPYTLRCSLCRNIIVAAEDPIPEEIVSLLEGTPCSQCVDPHDFIHKIRQGNED